MHRALIIFVKYPEPGSVKSRLGVSIGKDQAAQIYSCFVKTLLSNLAEENYKTYIFFSPPEKAKEIKKWLGQEYTFVAQYGNGLGLRMYNAFDHVFGNGAEQAVIIGTDIPLIENKNIIDAFTALKEKDCVIGPAYDGGYYLLGLNSLRAELFALKEYSTDKVFENTMAKAQKLGLNVEVLDRRFDVDTIDDLRMLNQELKKSHFCNNSNYNDLRDKIRQF